MRKFVLIGALFLSASAMRAATVDGIYVVVNDSVITYQEVEKVIAPLQEFLYKTYGKDEQVFRQKVEQARADKIDELIQRELVLTEFKTAGYGLPESVVDDLIRDRIKERFGDRATLTKTLQAQGMSFEAFRKQVRDDYIVRQMIYMKTSSDKIFISPQKIEDFYNAHADKYKVSDQVKLRMIVLNKTNPDDSAPRKLAEEILKKIEGGASFAEMAGVYSDTQKANGGDRGWVDRTLFKKELSDAAFALKPGQHSGVVDLPEACYLLLVEDAQTAHTKTLAEVRDEIETTLKSDEKTRLQKQWIDRLKSKAFIRYF